MNFDIQQLNTYTKEQLEAFHDEAHIMFNKLLRGEKIDYTFRKLHYLHTALKNALIRTGGKHISPIDQLDNLQMLEESKGSEDDNENKKEEEQEDLNEFLLLEYLDLNGTAKNVWAIQLAEKIFELELNPLVSDILFSIKKELDQDGQVLDKGKFKTIEDNENLLSVELLGKRLKGIYNFKRNNAQSDIWKLSIEGVVEKLSQRFGEAISNEEINRINFLKSNKVGASEIANLMSRPVQTIYNWIDKLTK